MSVRNNAEGGSEDKWDERTKEEYLDLAGVSFCPFPPEPVVYLIAGLSCEGFGLAEGSTILGRVPR